MTTLRRTTELVLLPLGFAAAMTVPALLWRERLPDPMAIHWGFNGVPDGSGSLHFALWLMLSILVTAWVAVVIGLAQRAVGGSEARAIVAGFYWLAVVLIGVWLFGLRANLDAATWQDAANLPGWQAFLAMLAGLPVAGLGWWLASDRPKATSDHRGERVTGAAPVAGRAVVWSGSADNRVLAAIGFLPLLVSTGLALVVKGGWVAPLITAPIALVVAVLATRVSVTIGPTGVRIGLGWFDWPVRTVPLGAIEEVRVEDVRPMRYGGWGYRAVAGARAHVVRSGPALRLERRDKTALLVTVDDAQRGAEVLAGYLEASPPATSAAST